MNRYGNDFKLLHIYIYIHIYIYNTTNYAVTSWNEKQSPRKDDIVACKLHVPLQCTMRVATY